jgi:hypothetical protein
VLHAVEVLGEGLRIRVVRVQPEQLVVELPGSTRVVRFVEIGHPGQRSG